MLLLQFNIKNPFSDRWSLVNSWAGITPFKNKFWEIQINKSSDIVAFELKFTTRQDHAGLFVMTALFGFELMFNLYDSRHWNYIDKKWED